MIKKYFTSGEMKLLQAGVVISLFCLMIDVVLPRPVKALLWVSAGVFDVIAAVLFIRIVRRGGFKKDWVALLQIVMTAALFNVLAATANF